MHLSLLQNTKCLNFAHYECLPSVLFCTFPTFLVRGNLSALSGYQSFTRSENFLFPPENDPDFLFRILQEKSVLAKHCMLLFPFFLDLCACTGGCGQGRIGHCTFACKALNPASPVMHRMSLTVIWMQMSLISTLRLLFLDNNSSRLAIDFQRGVKKYVQLSFHEFHAHSVY